MSFSSIVPRGTHGKGADRLSRFSITTALVACIWEVVHEAVSVAAHPRTHGRADDVAAPINRS